MLSRSSFVCLRCQLRQFSPVPRRLPPVPLTRLDGRRYGTETGPAPVDDGADGPGPAGPARIRKITADHRRGRKHDPGEADSSQFFLSRGKRLYMKPKDLQGMETLGRPAEAIVMKDVGAVRRRERASVEAEGEEHDSLVGVLDSLVDERREVTADEVQANIDELRPLDSDVIPEKLFMEIAEVLQQGFTAAQLQEYIRNNLREDLGHDDVGGTYPWVEDKSPWVPARAETTSPTEPHLLGYVDKSTTPKRKTVMRLMRECWGVSNRELNDRPGRLDVRVRELEFSLLMLGTQRWLQIVARVFLESGGRIELFRQRGLLRITASRAQAGAILADINARLRDVRTASFRAADAVSGEVGPAALQELGRVTNSVVARDGDDIRVSWINIESRDPGLEDIRDTVFRLLLASDVASKRQVHLHVRGSDGELRLVRDHTEKEKLPWYERSSPRGRWVAPKGQETTVLSTFSWPEDCLPWGIEQTGASVVETSEADSLLPPLDSETECHDWSATPTITTTALFGHILHPCSSNSTAPPKSQHSSDPNHGPPAMAHTIPHEGQPVDGEHVSLQGTHSISPTLPTLTRLPSHLPAADAPAPTVVLRFVPQPDDPAAADAPALELELDASDPADLRPRVLRAAVASRRDDVLLPSAPADVRLAQAAIFSVPGRSLPRLSSLAPLCAFLAASRLNLDQGNLATPARVDGLGLPARLFRAALGTAPVSDAAAPPVAVSYLFAGLEMRRAVASSLRGWRLLFTSVEAGRGGGRRLEMTLDGVRVPSTVPTPSTPEGSAPRASLSEERQPADLRASFLEAVTAVVDGTDFPWTG